MYIRDVLLIVSMPDFLVDGTLRGIQMMDLDLHTWSQSSLSWSSISWFKILDMEVGESNRFMSFALPSSPDGTSCLRMVPWNQIHPDHHQLWDFEESSIALRS